MQFIALSLSAKAVIKPRVAIHSYDNQAAVTGSTEAVIATFGLVCTLPLGGWQLCIQTFSLGSYLCYPRPELIRVHELVGVKSDPTLFAPFWVLS